LKSGRLQLNRLLKSYTRPRGYGFRGELCMCWLFALIDLFGYQKMLVVERILLTMIV